MLGNPTKVTPPPPKMKLVNFHVTIIQTDVDYDDDDDSGGGCLMLLLFFCCRYGL